MCGIARDGRHVLIACAGTCTCINRFENFQACFRCENFQACLGVKFSGLFRCETFQAYLGVKYQA